jgi:hypothetical protein
MKKTRPLGTQPATVMAGLDERKFKNKKAPVETGA